MSQTRRDDARGSHSSTAELAAATAGLVPTIYSPFQGV
jgi:hypothetical protein